MMSDRAATDIELLPSRGSYGSWIEGTMAGILLVHTVGGCGYRR
jgi:hypothetical protein